ncbi:MAG: putative selenate reductase subunit YgfK [Fretibacterium sp.]|nr:putative selenate reductase subunit YgfK [Fretibacterium sp.]
MSHIMRPQSFSTLLNWIEREYKEKDSIFGIHKSLFWKPEKKRFFVPELFGSPLLTPVGPAAGPNTQLTQNILAAWLCGARYMELKTVQIMDELELGRPCIDVEDEGYNVEWSQELKLEQSIREYVKAWLLIPVLERLLGWEKTEGAGGLIFNMSVGYNLEGILEPRMQTFIAKMLDASEELEEYREVLRKEFPQYADITAPKALVNSATLSTMHGCPPDEIGKIASYLLENRGFHLFVKMNPTLLGRDEVRSLLNETLGYSDIQIPDPVFEHDLKYPQALEIIKMMKEASKRTGKFFGVKLTNTLGMSNHRCIMPGEEMYMSGRSLYPISMNLWNRLSKDCGGDLNVSYSAGADAKNIAGIFACGALTVTMASDLLKPGGYGRIVHCLKNLESALEKAGAANLKAFSAGAPENLEKAAADALKAPRYKKGYYPGAPKVSSGLGLFDCIEAPCMSQCAVCQDIPEYAGLIARGDYDGALSVILRKNPLPGLTGYVCTHLCQTRCTRANYDEAVEVRALKRFASEHGRVAVPQVKKSNRKVAVIGGGPAGLAAAMRLALAGIEVTLYEARQRLGGMMAIAPVFRLPHAVMDADVQRLKDLGVKFVLGHKVTEPPESFLEQGFDAVFVATGFPEEVPLKLEGIDSKGVWTAMELLETTMDGSRPDLGKKALVIGGGNTAMDAARTAARLTGAPVTVVYRRSREEMPAIEEERELLFEEGNLLEELAAPVRVLVKDGRVAGLECERTKLGEADLDGRRTPVPTGEKFVLEADSLVVAIGQGADRSLFENGRISLRRNGSVITTQAGRTSRSGVYSGGDLTRGPDIVIAACADGTRAAEAICLELGVELPELPGLPHPTIQEILSSKKARTRKQSPHREAHLPVSERKGFELVERTLSETDARAEAARCLQCTSHCDKCVEVCPNRANYSYITTPTSLSLPVFEARDGRAEVVATEVFSLRQSRQILHIEDFCNECGNCATFCVHSGKPYMDKPRICLNDEDYKTQDDNVYRISENSLRRREGGVEMTLEALNDGCWRYTDDALEVLLNQAFAVKKAELKGSLKGRRSLLPAAEMKVLYEGIRNSMPWLL